MKFKRGNNVKIYISADEAKEMLRVKAGLKAGYVRVIPEKVEPAPQSQESGENPVKNSTG